MKKKRIFLVAACILLVLMNVFIITHKEEPNGEYKISIEMESDQEQDIQVYFLGDNEISEENSQTLKCNANEKQTLTYTLPVWTKLIRLDLGNQQGIFDIGNVELKYKNNVIPIENFKQNNFENTQQISNIKIVDGTTTLYTDGNDPFLWISLPTDELYPEVVKNSSRRNLIVNILMLLMLDGGVGFAIWKRKKVLSLPLELYHNRSLIWGLSKNDFKTKYAGSYLGIVWAFVQPVVTIMVYWFVFSVGLKAGDMSDYPFVLYLVSGIIPWFFFQDALNGGTNALIEYNYLVKKVVFKISTLPLVKVISAFFVHGFFVTFALVLCACYGYLPGWHTLQIIYYSGCTFLLVLGLVYATSAIVIFFRDLTQIISIFLQVGVWLTPIMWDLQILANHPWVIKLFKLNPMYYIVSGYRDSMLGHVWFWQHWEWTLYFWIVVVVLFAVGTVIFKRLKPHFADVL